MSDTLEALREKVAAEFEIPADRLQGDTEDELKADAIRLQELLSYSGDGSIAEHLGRLFGRDRRVNYADPYIVDYRMSPSNRSSE